MDYRKICGQLIRELRDERSLHAFYAEEFRKCEERLRSDPDTQADKEIGDLIEDRLETRRQVEEAIKQIDKLTKIIDATL